MGFGGDKMMMSHSEPCTSDATAPELLAWVLDRHAAALQLYARQLCDCPEDVVQMALVELAGQTTRPADVVGWLYGVVRHKGLTAARAAGRRRRHELAAGQQRGQWFVDSPHDEFCPESVARALDELPHEDRELIVGRVWGELTFRQLAVLLGVSDSAAHRRYTAALDHMRERLGALCPKKT
jgi:RNA polymerase sigma-70 factor (ECF subfamily)